jgi:hypothetical protein
MSMCNLYVKDGYSSCIDGYIFTTGLVAEVQLGIDGCCFSAPPRLSYAVLDTITDEKAVIEA